MMTNREFHIRVANDDLVFSAAHSITFEGGGSERLHGHTYRVAVEVYGPLNNSGYVVDFLVVRDALKDIIAGLDHRVLLPAQHPAIRVVTQRGEVEVTFAEWRWVFPEDDCALLPIANTTTELLAQHIGERLVAAIASSTGTPARVQIEIGEGSGFSAVCDLRL